MEHSVSDVAVSLYSLCNIEIVFVFLSVIGIKWKMKILLLM